MNLLEIETAPNNQSPGLFLPVWLFFKSVLEISEKSCEEIEQSLEKVLGFLALCRFTIDFRREGFILKVKRHILRILLA